MTQAPGGAPASRRVGPKGPPLPTSRAFGVTASEG
eukprot:CAMPEP_0198435808 /NCGR_PEP_ID=MMETSP1452-20131203/39716_1 /TAXON_ID=1181717 /ORGANISM="Synchroma pusillum, Strain CCMP3072" /LENGTH=34 /DNA_ID= /DNA_START= /DNA_END= /DNA_ORIENTATION=